MGAGEGKNNGKWAMKNLVVSIEAQERSSTTLSLHITFLMSGTGYFTCHHDMSGNMVFIMDDTGAVEKFHL